MKYPALYEVNIRARLRELGAETFDEIPDSELDRLASRGFNWIYLLGAWQTGDAAPAYSRTLYPDLPPSNICGSMFAVTGYQGNAAFGGTPALKRLAERLRRRGLRLMLDFVPNHTAVDHPWAATHPDYYIPGDGPGGLAHGRDPNFPPWPDTLQLDYSKPAVRQAMLDELRNIASIADGVRCDMAMLILPEVFKRTWGRDMAPFWPQAIEVIRAEHPEFLFLAEVYWDLEWTLQQQGFAFCYDKRLYDRLRSGDAGPVRDHLRAGLDYQSKLARFLENHDEPRAAGVFTDAMHQAAAVLTYGSPGLRFFHEGQLGGRKQYLPVHLCRAPLEGANPVLQDFYMRLLTALPKGDCRLLDLALPCIGWSWAQSLVVVNYSANRTSCTVPNTFGNLSEVMCNAEYKFDANSLSLNLPPWGYGIWSTS